MKLAEVITDGKSTNRRAVGIVPFISDGRCFFAIQRGPEPMIAMDTVDADHEPKELAVTYGEHHLGLRKSNMAAQPWLAWSGMIRGSSNSYDVDVYVVLVKDAQAFSHYPELGTWLTESEFAAKGRKSQTQIMDKVFDKIEVYLKT